jgi:hypothetical protein
MRTLILADRSFAVRERAMLSRLEIGLADEGVRVVHAVPRSMVGSEGVGLYSSVVGYAEAGRFETRWSLRRRAADLVRAVEDVTGGSAALDVVHVFGGPAWRLGVEVARRTGAAPVLELWRPALLGLAAAVGATPGTGRPPTFIVSEPALAGALRSRVPGARTAEAPWGVHTPPELPPRGRPDHPLAVALLSDTGDARALTPALAGLMEATKGGPEILIFAAVEDATKSREAALWSAARRLGVLDRLSMTPQLEARREPVLQMDMLLMPEAHGRERTLVLEAMSSAMLVVAAADPFMGSLVDGVTATLVRSPTTAAWAEAVAGVLKNPARADALVTSAHAWVHANRPASGQVAGVLKVYDALAADAPAAIAPTRTDA